MSLDIIGIIYGTDKSFLRNDYLRHYERWFAQFRDQPINLIEIGIQDGASLRMWNAYFQHATIIGLDLEPTCKKHEVGRTKVEIGSQADASFLTKVMEKYRQPTIIIDDGSHQADHQIFTFERLFNALVPGGCYVIEDLSTRQDSLGESTTSAPDFIAHLHKGIMAKWDFGWEPRYDPIDRIESIPGAVAIWKKPWQVDTLDIDALEDLTLRSGVPLAWDHLAWFVETKIQDLDRALSIASRGAQIQPWNPWFQLRISEILLKTGDKAAAIAAAEKAVQLKPEQDYFKQNLERIKAAKNSQGLP